MYGIIAGIQSRSTTTCNDECHIASTLQALRERNYMKFIERRSATIDNTRAVYLRECGEWSYGPAEAESDKTDSSVTLYRKSKSPRTETVISRIKTSRFRVDGGVSTLRWKLTFPVAFANNSDVAELGQVSWILSGKQEEKEEEEDDDDDERGGG